MIKKFPNFCKELLEILITKLLNKINPIAIVQPWLYRQNGSIIPPKVSYLNL